MSNRVTTEQLAGMAKDEIASLPAPMLAMLFEEVAALKAHAKALDEKLYAALETRYAAQAQYRRRQAGKDTGTVTLDDDGVRVSADLPKRVSWDQDKLNQAVNTIRAMAENPLEYVSIRIDVAESRFNAWPSSLREMFEPARTVGVGKATYKLEMKGAA